MGAAAEKTKTIEPAVSDLPTSIYRAMPAIMKDVGAVAKGRRNEQQGYSFRGIDEVYEHCQLVLANHGVFVVPYVQAQAREERATKTGGVLTYTILTVDHTFYAEDGSNVVARTIGEAMDSGDKSSNKAMSAAMKYALIESLCIPTREPKDTENDSPEPAPRRAGHANAGGMMHQAPPDIEPLKSTLPDEYTEPVPVYDARTGDIVGKSPKLTSDQNAKIHVLLGQLGHHMDEAKTGKAGAAGEIVKGGKYRKKLREKFCKDHANELSGIEASWVIEWLLKCVDKLERAADRGNPTSGGLAPAPKGPPVTGPSVVTTPPPATSMTATEAPKEVIGQLQALMNLTHQLVANGHKGTETQLAWIKQTIGRHVNAGTDLTEEEITKCLAVAEGQA